MVTAGEGVSPFHYFPTMSLELRHCSAAIRWSVPRDVEAADIKSLTSSILMLFNNLDAMVNVIAVSK